jgi:Sulfotransferase family
VTDRRYCFIFGCPRSGTTALTRLLNSHEAFVVGMERYKYHYSSTQGRAALGPDFFEPGRYFDFRPEDTNITPSNERFARFYERARRRFDAATVVYVGDKVLATDPILDAIRENFPDPRFIFIYRDLFRVASSWEVRARNENDENWVAANDYRVAGERWQGAFEVAERLIDQIGLEHVSLVRYERMFNGDVCHFDALLRRFDVAMTRQSRLHYNTATAKWDMHASKSSSLSDEQRAELASSVDTTIASRFDALLDEQLGSDEAAPV